jgi:hypothetical protein
MKTIYKCKYLVWFMVYNATFNNISVILWWSVLKVEETVVPGENHRPITSHWQTLSHNVAVLAVDDCHVAFCEYNGSVARIICVAVATLANEKLLECASDNDLLLCRKSTSNKTRYRQWFDRCIISNMILKSRSNWLFPVVFSVETSITVSTAH